MSKKVAPVVLDVQALLEALDLEGVLARLDALVDDERATLSTWIASSRTWCTEASGRLLREDLELGRAYDRETPVTRYDLPWLVAIVAATTMGPAGAAERIPWDELDLTNRRTVLRAALDERLKLHDETWASTFAERASGLGDIGYGTRDYSSILHALLVRHGLPSPTGGTFAASRLHRRKTVLDALADEPLMPSILLAAIAAGATGSSSTLPDAAPTLIDRGRIARSDLRDACLESLTHDSAPSHQRVLVKVLVSIGLQGDEVPGGLTYLLGVLATRTGTVTGALLPLALELVQSAADLDDIVAVVASRPERQQKQLVLRWASKHGAASPIGAGAVAAALGRLVEHDDDAAFRDKVHAAARRLVPETARAPEPGRTTSSTGLWDAAPQPQGLSGPRWWGHEAPSWRWALDRDNDPKATQAWICDLLLTDMASGQLDTGRMLRDVVDLLTTGHLLVPRLVAMLEELFLGGGLAQMWAPTLEMANALAARRPSGLAALLRLLATYAPGCPPLAPPTEIVALAEGGGSTKAAVEARVLLSHLARGEDGPTNEARDVRRGLWAQPADPHPGPRWLPDLTSGTVGVDLVERLALSERSLDQAGTRCGDLEWVRPAVNLQAVVTSIADNGHDATAAAVRRAARTLRATTYTHAASTAGLALEAWASGAVTPDRLLALRDARPLSWEEQTSDDDEVWERMPHSYVRFERIERILTSTDVCLPAHRLDPAALLHLLHACECLLLAPERTTVLSTPTRSDGSLDLDTLLDRLGAPGPIGPIDLVLALHRLAGLDSSDPSERLVALDGQVHTDARLSGGAPLPVAATVRRWVDAGGLGPLRSASDGYQPWSHHARRPVRWSEVATAPIGLDDLRPTSAPGAWLRITPRWPDLVRDQPLRNAERCTAAALAEQLELVGHGRPTADWLVGGLLDARRATDDLIDVATRRAPVGWPGPALLSESVVAHLGAGTTTVTTATTTFETLFARGGMQTWWEPALALADAACTAFPRPTGLSRFLAMLADHVHEVPMPTLPPAIRSMASARGSTQAHQQARRLIAGAARP